MSNCNVEDICIGNPDSQNQDILEVYARRAPDYAVYRTKQRVCLQYADDRAKNASQRGAMAPLNPIRGEINGLIDGWRRSPLGGREERAIRYDRRVGDALVVAFEEDVTSARTLLDQVKADILDERGAWARFQYLIWAFATVAFAMVVVLGVIQRDIDTAAHLVWRAATAGAVGAFFSIALSISNRSIRPDMQAVANAMDAILRILIGVIAAAALATFVLARAVTIAIGEAKLGAECDSKSWLYVLIVGFIAGFSERFVPDLLAKASSTTDAPAPVPPTTEKKAANAPGGPPPREDGAKTAAADAPKDEVDPLPDQARADDCACSIELTDEEATKDEHLPPASGGVASARLGGEGGVP